MDSKPPRVRSRPAPDTPDVVHDLAERVFLGPLPEGEADRVRSLAARNSKEMMPFIYDALFKLRAAGMLFEEIAARFQVTPRTVYRWWAKAKPWVVEQQTKLDPAYVYAKRMRELDDRRSRLTAMMQDTTDKIVAAKLSAELNRIDEIERRWMEANGYFGAFGISETLRGGEDSAEARATLVRDALLSAFDEVGEGDLLLRCTRRRPFARLTWHSRPLLRQRSWDLQAREDRAHPRRRA